MQPDPDGLKFGDKQKKKNIQKMLRGSLEVPEFDIKGEMVLQPLYGASKTNWCVSTKNGSVSSWLPEKKSFSGQTNASKE